MGCCRSLRQRLLLRLLPRLDSHSGLFAAYEPCWRKLAAADGEEPPLRRFEKRLLEELGYGLTLDREAASGTPIVAEERYCYVLDRGPLAASQTQTGVPISGLGLLALRDGILSDPTVLKEVKRLTRAALAEQLRGRALKTRELYRSSGNPRRRYSDRFGLHGYYSPILASTLALWEFPG